MNLKPMALALGFATGLYATQALSFAPLSTSEPGTASVAAGSQLVFAPVSGASRLTLTHLQNGDLRITVLTETSLNLTPDPKGMASYRSWILVAGTELTLNAGGLDLTTKRNAESTTVLLGSSNPLGANILRSGQGAAMTAATSINLSMDPDPGSGNP